MASKDFAGEMTGKAIGIDLGGTRIKAALIGADGTASRSLNEPLNSRDDYSQILTQVSDIIGQLDAGERLPIGIAVAGLMDAAQSSVITAPNIPALAGRSMPDDLYNQFHTDVVMDNDANMMALGEGAFGAGRGCRHYVALMLGTGVGGAIVNDGELLRGYNGGGGELGHVPISFDGPRCGCGSSGCLEAYIGAAGVERYLMATMPELAGLGMKEINRRANQGDRNACAVFAWMGRMLAVAASGWVNLFNPQMLIIGGGVAAAGDLFIRPMRSELERRAFAPYLKGLSIVPATLGNMAGVVGAGWLAQRRTNQSG